MIGLVIQHSIVKELYLDPYGFWNPLHNSGKHFSLGVFATAREWGGIVCGIYKTDTTHTVKPITEKQYLRCLTKLQEIKK